MMIGLRVAAARLAKPPAIRSEPTDTGASDGASGVSDNRGEAKPKSAEPSVSTPARSNVVLRAITAFGETRLQIVLAAIITVGSGLWAWSLAATAFAAPPHLAIPPGIIGVAVESSSSSALAPIDVRAAYYPATPQAGSYLDLTFSQIVTAQDSKKPSPTVIVFLCGTAAEHPAFGDGRTFPIAWRVPSSPDGVVESSIFGFLSRCVYTTLPMPILGPPGEYRTASIVGSFATALSATSGTKVLYDLPGIANWSMPVPIDGLTPSAMPAGSTVTVGLAQDPSDYENMFTDPQLPDAGTLTWTSKIDATAPPVLEYRLEADIQTDVSQLQLHLFIAGALVGVAGGAFMWFVQLIGQAGYEAVASRTKRSKSADDRGSDSSTAEHEVPVSEARESSEPEGAGLGLAEHAQPAGTTRVVPVAIRRHVVFEQPRRRKPKQRLDSRSCDS